MLDLISFYAGNLFPSNFKSVFLAFHRFNFGFFRLVFIRRLFSCLVVVVAFVVVVVFALLNDLLNSFAIEYAPSTILLSAVIWLAVVEVVNCEETLESVVVLDGIVISSEQSRL
mgnify:CR=1 FL=1